MNKPVVPAQIAAQLIGQVDMRDVVAAARSHCKVGGDVERIG